MEGYFLDIYNAASLNEGRKISEREIKEKFEQLRRPYIFIYYSMNDTASMMESNFSTNIANTQYSLLVQDMLADFIYNAYAYKDDTAQKYIESITP